MSSELQFFLGQTPIGSTWGNWGDGGKDFERCSTLSAPAWPLAWPGPQEGFGQGGPRLKWAKGRFGSKNDEKVKVLRMEFSIVENLSGLQESIFNLSRGPQLHFGEKSKNW